MDDVDLLLIARYVVTAGKQGRVVPRGAVAIRNGLVIDVGPEEELRSRYSAREVVERRHHVVVPGFLDCHTHTQQYLLRSAVSDRMLQLPPVWTRLLVPFERRLDRRLARLSSRASIANMLKNGVTYFVEAGAPHPDVLAEEVLASGIKGVVTYATYDVADGVVAEPEEVVREARRLFESYGRLRGKLRVWMSIRQVMMVSERLLGDVLAMCEELGTGLTLHLGEYQGEVDYTLARYGLRPLEFMVGRGLGRVKPVVMAHGVFLSPEEVELVRSHGFGVCWCPTVDSWLMGPHWAGFAYARGVKVGVGTDGGAWGRLDPLHEAKVAKALGKALANAVAYFKAGLDSATLLDMVTGLGGDLVGERVGRIERGYPADLVVLSFNSIDLLPVNDPLDLVVNYMEGRDVTDVLVDGRFVVRNGRLMTIDEERLLKEVLDEEDTVRSLIEELARQLPLR